MKPFDIILAGGEILDGTGAPAIRADIGLRGDTISAVGSLDGTQARQTIDVGGCFVAPGFIDTHSHSDAYILIEPSAASKIHQGVTTEITGQCGASAAPLLDGYKLPSDWRSMTFPGTWSSLAEYRMLLDSVHPALNIATLTGHNTLRAGVMGYAPRPSTDAEQERMNGLLRDSLAQGSRGLSTGLLYPPGKHAQLEEVHALARIVSEAGGIYATHMRSEGDQLIEALTETLDVARQTGVCLQISHLKTSGVANWPLLDEALELIYAAQKEGVRVMADRYPYTAACTDLDVLLPDWVFAEGPAQELHYLHDPVTRERIRRETLAARSEDYWSSVHIGSTWHPDHAVFKGKPLPEVAQVLGLHPVDAVLRLIEDDNLKTGGIFFGMSEENMWRILALPFVMIGSDASLRAPTGPLSQDHPHPRAYGAFAKFLRASFDGLTVSLPEAIRKMTSLPAQQFNLQGRGVIREGCFADLTVFTSEVRDRATYRHPHAPATGFKAVLVNGRVVLEDDRLTGERGGRFLP
ncbi:MAG: D-aminoacylase [Kiritimatiellae bacterium]|nr:D-aminoacylase [Kiritimatiellia bacterium]